MTRTPDAPVRARKRWWVTGSFWTPKRDEQLRHLQGEGLWAAKIAERLGTTRNSILGRLHSLSGARFTYPSYIRQLREAGARNAPRIKKRAGLRRAAIAKMQQEIGRGLERNRAMVRAQKAGATLNALGMHSGLQGSASKKLATAQNKGR